MMGHGIYTKKNVMGYFLGDSLGVLLELLYIVGDAILVDIGDTVGESWVQDI